MSRTKQILISLSEVRNISYIAVDTSSLKYISHYGVKGQKWGVRRYQHEDGTRTDLGQQHRRDLKRENAVKNKEEYLNTIKSKATSNRVEGSYKNRGDAIRKFEKRVNRTAEGKRFSKVVEYENSDDWKEDQFVPLEARKIIDSLPSALVSELRSSYIDRHNEMASKFMDRYRGAMLKDFGLKNTEIGRDYLKQLGFSDDYLNFKK